MARQNLENTEATYDRADARWLDKMEKRWDAADEMIGELASGKLYVYPIGGKYREGTRSELTDFLIRNNYA